MFKSKLFSIAVSAVVALCLYAYVITFVSAEREETFYDIPVSYQGEALLNDRRLMVTSEAKPTVTLTLYGKRSELRKLTSENITILADLSKIGEPGTHSLLPSIIYPGTVPDNAFSVMSQYPTMVKVSVEKRVTKEVPVQIVYTGGVPESYILDQESMLVDRETITVSGPASATDPISKAMVSVDLTDRTASFVESYRYTLCDAAGNPVDAKQVETNAAEVSVTLYIDRILEIPLSVTVIDGGGATEKTSEILIDPLTIKVAGSESQLEQLGETLILGEINLAELRGDTVLKLPINLPEGLDTLSGKTEANVSVKFPALGIRNFTISSNKFEALNVPDGVEVVFISSEIVVTVRGPKALVARMTASDILISVDYAGKPLGTNDEKAVVTMGPGFTEAGAIGNYRIFATLQEIVTEVTE